MHQFKSVNQEQRPTLLNNDTFLFWISSDSESRGESILVLLVPDYKYQQSVAKKMFVVSGS